MHANIFYNHNTVNWDLNENIKPVASGKLVNINFIKINEFFWDFKFEKL